LIRNPINGQDRNQPEKLLILEALQIARVDGLSVPEDGDQDREADRDLGRGDAHDDQHEQLPRGLP
jgi:hypothetical protein